MMVFWDQKLVFLATPKTGSTSLAMALESEAAVSVQRPPLLKHTTLHRYHRFIRPYLEAASKTEWQVVALIREPIDWLGSWYRYRRRDDQTDPAKSTKEISFDQFVSAYCSQARPEYADVGAQERFLRPRRDQGIDHLFRYDQMDKFIDFLQDRFGKNITLQPYNVSPWADLTLSQGNRERLESVLAEDFALYEAAGR